MKSIDELDHYELLEIPRTATQSEVERAYRLAQQTYAENSLALYSVFENIDAAAIRSRLDEAYQVLANPELRDDYDRKFKADDSKRGSNSAADMGMEIDLEREEKSSFQATSYTSTDQASSYSVATPQTLSTDEGAFDAFDEIVDEFDAHEEDGGGDFDGVRLRRTRLFRGFEIDDISNVTKVSGAHLRNIEEENFADLPADVYLRGFVTAYAKTIGLDPKVVVPGYMARVEQSREAGQRGRFLGRR